MNRYHVKSSKLTFGETVFDMATGPAAKGETKEAVDVTALTDVIKQFIPGAVKEVDEFTVSLYDKGSGMPTVDAAPAQLKLEVALDNGQVSQPVTATVTYNKAIVTKVTPPNHDASGDRKATIDVTFKPDGSVAAQAQGGNGGSGNGGSGTQA